jgi:Uncharacterized conserved protein (DUF2163)
MRTVIGGDGSDTTAAVAAWLSSNRQIALANLILIGEPEDPLAQWLTDYESPLNWPLWGTFQPAVIKRGRITTKIGLEVESLDLTWSPPVTAPTQNISTANPFQLAQAGVFDNMRVRIWTCYMPTPGDANTFGASELFGGQIGDCSIKNAQLAITVNSWLAVVNQQVPTNVIELTNTQAAYNGAVPPKNYSSVPFFTVVAGSSPSVIVADCTSDAHHIFGNNSFQHGYMVFLSGAGATLAGLWASVQQNTKITVPGGYGGAHSDYNQFVLYTPLPWTPTPGVDKFYVSGASPVDQSDGDYYGFPYVPDPALSV